MSVALIPRDGLYEALADDEDYQAEQERWHQANDRMEYHLLEALEIAQQFHRHDPFTEVEHMLWQLQRKYRKAIGWKKPEVLNGRIPFAKGQRKRILERDAYRCVLCGSHLNLCVDHIVAVSRGGTNADENLRCLCRTCNLKKGARPE